MRASGTDNHHDLGLFSVGPDAPAPQPGRVGLYHLAWQVDSIQRPRRRCASASGRLGALVGASDHGVSKSLYAQDPDGNEFEVMWEVPATDWGATPSTRPVAQPLDLDRRARPLRLTPPRVLATIGDRNGRRIVAESWWRWSV